MNSDVILTKRELSLLSSGPYPGMLVVKNMEINVAGIVCNADEVTIRNIRNSSINLSRLRNYFF
jgi:hypothetical protein